MKNTAMRELVNIDLFDKILNQDPSQMIEGRVLTRGVGANSRGRIFDNPVSKVGVYSKRGACSRGV